MSSPGGRFVALDGLRGVAALMVLLLHMATPSPVPSAYLAVDLFFLLSGFVLAHAYGDKLRSGFSVWRDFMAQRFLRLWPLYALGTLAGLMLHLYGMFKGWRADAPGDVAIAFAANSIFLPTPIALHSAVGAEFPFNPPGWSLFSEMAVNILFAYVARVRRWPLAAWVCGFGAIALIFMAVGFGELDVGGDFGRVYVDLLRPIFSFFLGVLLYEKRSWIAQRGWGLPAWIGMAALVAISMADVSAVQGVFDLICVMLVFPAIVLLCSQREPTGRFAKVCSALGLASFPLYVIHWPLVGFFGIAFDTLQIGPYRDYPLVMAAFMLVVLAIAIVLGMADERLRKALRARRAATPADAVKN